jgi:hypothetical protein
VNHLSLPICTNISVKGFIPDEAYIFKSAKSPLLLTFLTTDDKKFKVLFKSGLF